MVAVGPYNGRMTRVYLFDIDGTLIRSGGAGKAAMEAALAAVFGFTGDTDGVPFAGRTDRAIGRDLLQRVGADPTDANWRLFLDEYFRVLPDCLHRIGGRVLPGVTRLLDGLADRGDAAVGLLTGNARRGAELKLTHFGLWERFAFGGYGDDCEDRDEVARAAVLDANRHLGRVAEPSSLWVIGDTPFDVRCARAVGAVAVAVATGWHTPEALAAERPDVLLADLLDPSPLLAV
jgi:phosphoglycolate phosphatase